MRAALDALLAILFASPCLACGELLDEPSRGPVCPRCWASIRPLTPPLCDVCGDALASWRTLDSSPARCVRCRRAPGHVDRARAIGPYEGPLRAIVHALKYEGRRSLARPLAALMLARGAEVLTGVDTVIPVPLHHARRRERGFNQAADLASHLDLPVSRVLRRVHRTLPQAALPAAQRHRNVRGAFAVTPAGRQLADRTVLLVDDVSTTGATLEACASVLKEAGVREVRALTAARAVTAAPEAA